MNSRIERAKEVLKLESESIIELSKKLNTDFDRAVQYILDCQGKVITTGVGKSGQIARKIASTLSSTGTPALYLHAGESSHGDLGVIDKKDVILALSYGGETAELQALLHFAARRGITVLAMTGKTKSALALSAQVVLDISVSKEACPLGLAPTSSSTASLALGDALAMVVMHEKGFRAENFAELHPGGSLGAKLLTRVKDIMHIGQSFPLVSLQTPVREILTLMTHKDVRGTAGVVNDAGELVGVITDGDIRRQLEKNKNPLEGIAQDIMSHRPRVIESNELAEKALFLMEEFKIQVLFVLDSENPQDLRPVGLLHYQDLLKSKVR